MQINIEIDDELMDAVMKAGEFKTKRDAIEAGLRLIVRQDAYKKLRAARGKLSWSLRGDWTVDQSGKCEPGASNEAP